MILISDFMDSNMFGLMPSWFYKMDYCEILIFYYEDTKLWGFALRYTPKELVVMPYT